MRILAIDLGKTSSVACVYEVEDATRQFRRFRTTGQALQSLVNDIRPDRMVIEICPMAGWIADLITSMGVEVQVANVSAPAWRWSNTRRKTEGDDALRLAQLSSLNQLPQVAVPAPPTRQWRAMIRYRHQLIQRRTQIRNHIRALFDRQGLALPRRTACWTQAGIAALRTYAKNFEEVDMDELWRGELECELQALSAIEELVSQVEQKLDEIEQQQASCRLLRTIPGVGPRLAEIVAAVLDDPRRFSNSKQVACYAGLTPRQYQSGDTDRQGRISRQGNSLLRAMLVEVSWVSLRYNSWARQIYERVRRGSAGRKKIAIVAVARRLLVRCWAMLRDGTAWNPPLTVGVSV
ncbi:IS110 family RNA-guided transposase [Thalassoroseus pseudoceratinae]|uniref:IS110 family transposase n=1 Tax=Thalassoroseus pseudoceratinae TaxID=2713176 RepID=UPI00141E695A|nr:IS110 family transposase [Thalassoroseus pseudoceratinae]